MITLKSSESALTKETDAIARRNGWLVHGIGWAKGSARFIHGDTGFPDRIYVRDERMIAVEFKDEKNDPYENQMRWLNALSFVPGLEVRIWRPSTFIDGIIESVLD